MLEINDTELVFSFPDVDDKAILRIHFSPADSPDDWLSLRQRSDATLQFEMEIPFVMYLQPNYPVALLVSVGGKNAITGEPSSNLQRSPQNYFTSPPQGGVDGYFRNGRVIPFRSANQETANKTRLDLLLFPMKRKAMEYFRSQYKLIPGPAPSALRGTTLLHGGERLCEPIYEDICNLGTWDRNHTEKATLWIYGTTL